MKFLSNHLIVHWVKVLPSKLSIYYYSPVNEEILFYLKRTCFYTVCQCILLESSTSSPVKMFLNSRQAGYSNRQQRPKLQGPLEESGRSKRQIFRCRRPNGQPPAHFDWAALD